MTDINPIINELLSPYARTENEFPQSESTFPMITVTEISSVSERIADDEEILSDIVFQIDVWDKRTGSIQTRQRCETISEQVSRKLIQTGFSRCFAQSISEDEMFRKCMRFSGQIDEKKKIIHRR